MWTTRAPTSSTRPLLTFHGPTGAVEIMRQLHEALQERTEAAPTPTAGWTPEWNLATIPDAQLNSEVGRRRAGKRTYTHKAQPLTNELSVSE